MTKAEIAAVLDEIALLLELKGENPFKIRAYVNGARALESFEGDLASAIESGDIRKISGIGDALAEKITTLHRTGALPFYEKLRAEIPPGLLQMMDIPGLGPKKIKILHEKLAIDSIAKLQAACLSGQVAELSGFGKKTQDKLLDGIKHREAYSQRHLWWDAALIAEPILAGLRQLPEVSRAEHAGSLRRGLETVGDLDFIVGSTEPAPIMAWFTSMPTVTEVTARGETKSSVRLTGGLQADLRVVPPAQFASALHHFTGSKAHNVKLRQRALTRGWSLSEWGISPKDESSTALAPMVQDEAALFKFLDLHYIPPELREGIDEIETAEAGPLPRLVEEADIRGVFHNHTTASDGRNTLEDMAAAAEALGFEYLGIADHSKSSFQANGLDEARLEAQVKRIRELNDSGRFKLRILTGTECDILPNGSLDFSDAVLRELDYVVVSVHSSFNQSSEEMTARLCCALEHPLTTMLGHITGRLLLKRESNAVDIPKVIDTALAHHKIIELNSSPQRLELDWRHWKAAAARGLLCAINPDAHSTAGLAYYRAGVRIARKGWLTPENIINTRPLEAVLRHFADIKRFAVR
ncbi:MAG: DNA polymerase/3'-5' exonuclease PolX [Verrucomicrobiota bacterium]|nr:DNA polymerase/3'-5' exonuclease PolX [Verrucomicrobiota bacterium]